MTNLPISGLTAGTTITASDPFPTVQGGATVKVNADQIKDFVSETSIAFKGNLSVPAGSSTSPSLCVGTDGSSGFANPDDRLFVMAGNSVIAAFKSSGTAYFGDPLTTYTQAALGTFGFNRTGNNNFNLYADTGSLTQYMYQGSSDGVGPVIRTRKCRSGLTNPSSVSNGDTLFDILVNGWGDDAWKNSSRLRWSAIETGTSAGLASRMTAWFTTSGSTTLTECFRFEHGTGLSMYGANVVVDQNRLITNRTAAFGSFSTGAAGKQEFATDLGGGANLLVHDGSSWKRLGNGGYATVSSNADFTLTAITNAVNIRHTGTLTADRTITLSTTNAVAGSVFHITRTGSGAFNLSVGGLKNLTTNTWAEVVYDGSAWYLSAYGAL